MSSCRLIVIALMAVLFLVSPTLATAATRIDLDEESAIPVWNHSMYLVVNEVLFAASFDTAGGFLNISALHDSVKAIAVCRGGSRRADVIYALRSLDRNSILKSSDSGASWISLPIPGYAATDVAVDPISPDVVLVSSMARDARSYLSRSRDGGKSWRTEQIGEKISWSVFIGQPPQSRYVIFGLDGPTMSSMLRVSTDEGASWRDLSANLPNNPRRTGEATVHRATVNGITQLSDPTQSLIIATSAGVFVGDGGSWTHMGNSHAANRLCVSPSGNLYATCYGRLTRATPPYDAWDDIPAWSSGRVQEAYHHVGATDRIVVAVGVSDKLGYMTTEMANVVELPVSVGRQTALTRTGQRQKWGALAISTTPTGARVVILDSRYQGKVFKTPFKIDSFAAGAIRCEITLTEYEKLEKQLTVEPDSTRVVDIALKKDPGFTMDPCGDFRGHRYWIERVASDWKDAKLRCEAAGGHLVTIDSPEENAFVRNALARVQRSRAWIGLRITFVDLPHHDWLTDEPMTYEHWKKGQPVYGASVYQGAGTWMDVDGEWHEDEGTTAFAVLETE